METRKLYKETGEALTESMKILNLRNGPRDYAILKNTIETARTSQYANHTFQAYANLWQKEYQTVLVVKKPSNTMYHSKFLMLNLGIVIKDESVKEKEEEEEKEEQKEEEEEGEE